MGRGLAIFCRYATYTTKRVIMEGQTDMERRVQNAVAIARLDERMKHIELKLDRVDEIYEMLTEAKGGWKTLMIGGTIGAALAGLVLKAVALFKGL